jgi:hypothetical protein
MVCVDRMTRDYRIHFNLPRILMFTTQSYLLLLPLLRRLPHTLPSTHVQHAQVASPSSSTTLLLSQCCTCRSNSNAHELTCNSFTHASYPYQQIALRLNCQNYQQILPAVVSYNKHLVDLESCALVNTARIHLAHQAAQQVELIARFEAEFDNVEPQDMLRDTTTPPQPQSTPLPQGPHSIPFYTLACTAPILQLSFVIQGM